MIKWENLHNGEIPESGGVYTKVFRTKVPGGWLVMVYVPNNGNGLTFYPDPSHNWNGTSTN